MKLSIHILTDRKVSPLLRPGHLRYVVVHMDDDHVVARQLVQRLLHLDCHLLDRRLVGSPPAGGADDDLVSLVCHCIPLLDGVAAANEELPAGGEVMFPILQSIMYGGRT
jgi:hypothetical protein